MVDSYKIISNAFVITCDPLNRGGLYTLLIQDDRIAGISDKAELLTSAYPGATMIDATGKLIVPGFVNAHFHSESVLLSPYTRGLHYSLWGTNPAIQECISSLLDPEDGDVTRKMYLLSYFRHLKSGTTSVGEYSLPYGEAEFARMLHAIERTEVKTGVSLQNWDQIYTAGKMGSRRHRFLANVGKEEDFTVYSFESLLRAAKELRVPLLAHVAEQRAGAEFVRRTFQKGILAVLQDFGVVQPDTVFIHLNHLGGQDAEVLAQAGAPVVICARSAAFKRTGYPLLRYLAPERIRLAVGTDWESTDMLEELKFLFRLHLLISGIPPFSPMQLVRMGTINGAHALGLGHESGSIEAGKKADLTFFSLSDLRLPAIPEDPDAETLAAFLLDHLTSRDVSDVMINGEFFVARGEVMTMAEEEILQYYQSASSMLSQTVTGSRTAAVVPEGRLPGVIPKVLPFAHKGRTTSPQDQGFEAGFRPGADPDGRNKHERTSTPPTAAEEGKEQPRENWRTFGEEDF